MTKRYFLYARVSTANQSTGLEAQIRALKEYCRQKEITDYVIFQDENESGTKFSRPALDSMMKAVRNGEAKGVIVYSFSRYARSVTHLLYALQEMEKLGVGFVSITENIETHTPLGRALFTVLAAVAQLERDILAERVRNGLANAKAKGIKIGRKRQRPSDLIRTLRRSGVPYREIARICKVSQGAVGAELKSWKLELAKQHRTIDDEVADHKRELSERVAPKIMLESSNQGEPIGLELSAMPSIELEIVR